MHQSEATFDETRAITIDWDLRMESLENEIDHVLMERAQSGKSAPDGGPRSKQPQPIPREMRGNGG